MAAVEFALVLPMLILFALGTAEIGRAALLDMKVRHAATAVADLAARDESLSTAALDDIFSAAGQIVRPFGFGPSAVVIVSAVGKDTGTAAKVAWQRSGGGTLSVPSAIGSSGGTAALPATMVIRDGETLIVAEVFYRHTTWLLGLIPTYTLARSAYYRPRMGTLRTLT